MRNRVNFRFFQLSRHDENIPLFADVLREIAGIQPKNRRERQLSADFVVRLEEFEEDAPDSVIGEIIRVQSTNMPSEVLDDGRQRLSTNNPLGHSVVFRYDFQRSILGIQHDSRIASAGRLMEYVSSAWEGAFYNIYPVVKTDSWQRFNSGDTKKFGIRIARPSNLSVVDDNQSSVARGLKAMGDVYEAPYVHVELSMGRRGGFLSESVKALAHLLHFNDEQGGAHIDKMYAVTYVDDTREEIDLIQERLVVREDLELHDRDPQVNYRIKRDFLRDAMRQQFTRL